LQKPLLLSPCLVSPLVGLSTEGAVDVEHIRDIALAYELVPQKMAAFGTRAELMVEILATVSSARREQSSPPRSMPR